MNTVLQQMLRWASGAVAIGASLLASSPGVHATDGVAYVISDVQCDTNHNGVLDLTLINDRASQEAMFVISAPSSSTSSAIAVAAASVSAITFTDLADGALTVPVAIDGVDSGVAVRVACDAPEVAVLGAPVRQQSAGAQSLPVTGGPSAGEIIIASSLLAAGVAASLVARRRYS